MLSLYIASPTWLHNIRPSIKLATLAVASILLLPADRLEPLAAASLTGITGFLSLGASGRRRLIALTKTAGLLAALMGLFQLALTAADLGLQAASQLALVSSLRLFSLVLLADLVSITTPLTAMLEVIRALLPRSARHLGLMVGLMVRLGQLLRQRLDTLQQAFVARADKPAGLRVTAPLIRQIGCAQIHLADALLSRKLRQLQSSPNPSAADSAHHAHELPSL